MLEKLRDDEEDEEKATEGVERNVEIKGSVATRLLLLQPFIL
jgi:hypothetical protein